MNMKKALCTLLIGAAVGLLGGCGGGGGGGSTTTTVSGVVSKGIFTSGTVQFFEVGADGSQTLITTGTIDSNGHYNTDLGKAVSGPIVIKAYGTYLDEATQQTVTVPSTAPLKAVVSTTTATTIAVTPLTDLAAQKLIDGNGKMTATATAIDNTNKSIGALFGVTDIVKTQPVAFTVAALQGGTADQKAYTEVLAMVSQYVKNTAASSDPAALQTALGTSLTTLASGITPSSTGAVAAATDAFKTGLGAAYSAVTTSPNTQTTLAADPNAGTILLTALGGPQTVTYYLKVDDGSAGNVIEGIQADITLPAPLALAEGLVGSDVLAASGVYTGNGYLIGNVKSGVLHVGLVTTNAFGSGTFAILKFTIPASATPPQASELTVANTTVVDGSPSPVTLAATVSVATN